MIDLDPLIGPKWRHGYVKRFGYWALLALAVALPNNAQANTTIDASHQYSYGANIGWMNWLADSATDGVSVGEFICSGWIYSANVGWISMGNGSPANHVQYQNNSATDFGVNYGIDPTQPGYGILRGYAYGANIGWINFEATGNARVSLFTGRLSGYAYSANCGWINLDDMGVPANYVQTDHILMGTDSNANGIADAWEYLYFGGLLGSGQQNTVGPNGQTYLQDYLDGISPLTPNSALRITGFSTNAGGVSSNVTFTSNTGRLYTIEVNGDLTLPLNWTDSGLGMFAPDQGSSTTRVVTQASAARRFFRVKTMRPLP
jgi:hypothetical protein